MLKYILIFVFAVFIAALAQVLLKISANKPYKTVLEEYLNAQVILAYFMVFVSLLLTIYAYRRIELRFTPMLDSLAYIFVPILSYIILREKFNKNKLLGIITILVGVVVFGGFWR
jgi:drug/metabolite transporter (DMT)-like permease